MKQKNKIITATLVTLMVASSFAGITNSFAAETKAAATDTMKKGTDAVAAATAKVENKDIIKTVDEAYKALREIRGARLAIFNGEPGTATEIVQQAEMDLKAAQATMKDTMVAGITPTLKDDGYVPFDTSLSLSEGFVPTAEKQTTLKTANEHIAKGEHMKAVEALKLANIDVTVNAAFIPANASLDHAQDAVKLLTEGKYYQANLSLKAIEDSIVRQSFSVDSIPTQGTAG